MNELFEEENIEWIFNADCRDKKRTGNGIHGRAARLRKKEAVKMPSERETDKFQRKLILGAGPCYVTTLREMKLLELLDKVKSRQQVTIEEIKELPIHDGLDIYNELRKMYDIKELQATLKCSIRDIMELSSIFNLGWMKRIQYGEWISIGELKALPFDDGQKIYAELRRLHTTADMYKGFSCSSAQISEMSYHFQVARSGKTIVVGESALDILRGFTENRQNQAEQKRKSTPPTNNSTDKPKRQYKARTPKEESTTETQKEIAINTMYQEEIPADQLTLVEVKNPEIDLLRISVKNTYTADQIMAFLTRLQLFVEGQDNKFELSLTLQEKSS